MLGESVHQVLQYSPGNQIDPPTLKTDRQELEPI
jgi:hypothetical protein